MGDESMVNEMSVREHTKVKVANKFEENKEVQRATYKEMIELKDTTYVQHVHHIQKDKDPRSFTIPCTISYVSIS